MESIIIAKTFYGIWRPLIKSITGHPLLDAFESIKKRGVYLIFEYDIKNFNFILLYVGTSTNMSRRLYSDNHPVYNNELIKNDDYISSYHPIFFIDCDADRLRVEKKLIQSLRPKLNIHNNVK